MLINLAACAVLAMTAVFSIKLGLPRLNAITAFTASWVPMLFVAGLLGVAPHDLSDLTWLMIFAGWATLVVGALAGWFLSTPKENAKSTGPVRIDLTRTKRFHLALTATFALYVLMQILNAQPLIERLGGWSIVLNTSGNVYRNASLQSALDQSQSAFTTSSVFLSILSYFMFIAGSVATYTGTILWRAGHRVIGVIPVVSAAILSLVTLQRTSVVLVALLFIIGMNMLRLSKVEITARKREGRQSLPRRSDECSRRNRKRSVVAGCLVAAGLVTFMYYTTEVRSVRAQGTFDVQVSEYLVGGVAGLESRNAQGPDWAALPGDQPGTMDPIPGMGGYTFTGLWAVLYRSGLPVELTRANLDFVPMEVNGRRSFTNVVTALGEFYLDYRWPGLILIPLLVGFITSRLQRRMVGTKTLVRVPAATYLLTVIFWSYFVAWFSDLRQILVAVIGGPILTWAVTSRNRKEPELPRGRPDHVRSASGRDQ